MDASRPSFSSISTLPSRPWQRKGGVLRHACPRHTRYEGRCARRAFRSSGYYLQRGWRERRGSLVTRAWLLLPCVPAAARAGAERADQRPDSGMFELPCLRGPEAALRGPAAKYLRATSRSRVMSLVVFWGGWRLDPGGAGCGVGCVVWCLSCLGLKPGVVVTSFALRLWAGLFLKAFCKLRASGA